MPQLRNRPVGIQKDKQKDKQTENNSSKEPVFPMRINKYLALKNYSTRRGADEIITAKKVFINGKLAVLGDKVNETDTVEVRYRGKTAPTYTYVAYHKPVGVNTNDEIENRTIDNKTIGNIRIDNRKIKNKKRGKGEREIKDEKTERKKIPGIIATLPEDLQKLKLFPVGRLDKDSSGLIILTNDGRVTDRLLNPKHEHEKIYEVTTAKPLRDNFKEKIEAGLNIEGYVTKPTHAKQIGEKKFIITLTEGKTHQVRRMVSALFNEVRDLKRISIMNIRLNHLTPGTTRILEGTELEVFLKGLGL